MVLSPTLGVPRTRTKGELAIGYGPFSGAVARIAEALEMAHPDLSVRLQEEVTSESLRRVGAHELAAAVVMESPAAAHRHGVRVDVLKDEPLLAALPESHPHAGEATIPIRAFVAECVLLPREPPGQMFNAWLRALFRTHGFELERTMTSASAPVGSTHGSRGERRGRGRRDC
jgi:DNA-binding transcriptional LysR family regulator